MNKGYIYILTNPASPDWVKIGYTNRPIQERLNDLNSATGVILSYREYAHLEVDKERADLELHDFIDLVNPSLRSIERIDGKKREREFFRISPELALKILNQYAKIKGYDHKCVIVPPSYNEMAEEERVKVAKNTTMEVADYYATKNDNLVALSEKLIHQLVSTIDDLSLYANKNYIGIKNSKQTIGEIHIRKNDILIITKEPISENLLLGEAVPESFMWTLNYRVSFSNEKDVNNIVKILLESNNQILNKGKRKESFSFEKVGIKTGSKIVFIRDTSIQPLVVDSKKVEWNNKIYSLSSLAEELVGYICNGTLYFTYNGTVLSELLK